MAVKTKQSPKDFILEKPNRYRVTNTVTNQTYEASAFDADTACRKLGWRIAVCRCKIIGKG